MYLGASYPQPRPGGRSSIGYTAPPTVLPSLEQVVERCHAAMLDHREVKQAFDLAERLAWNDGETYEQLAEADRFALGELTDGLDLFEPNTEHHEPGLFGLDVALERIEVFLSRVSRKGAV